MGIRITQLPPDVFNQIAAGEVIERPASVIKELLENALDAGASLIQIELDYGGLNRIKVSDNGRGIIAEDLPLAVAPHATSKIHTINDLYGLSTMGFRGEALASIASVTRFTLISKTAAQAHAMQLTMVAGQPQITPAARENGTTIEVKDLFFNVPVRKKFLKSERIEYLAVEAMVKRLAMCQATVAFTLKHNGKLMLDLASAKTESEVLGRIKKLLGKDFLDSATCIDAEAGTLQLHGFMCSAQYQRSQNDKLWIYINQRLVKDKLIQHAIKQAYQEVIYPGRFPGCLLFLQLPPAEMDVNVHPTKYEVRFQQPRLVHDFIVKHMTQALALTQGVPTSTVSYPIRNDTLQIDESVFSEPSYALEKIVPSKGGYFIPLNSQFGLVFLKEEPFLIDIIKLHRHALEAWLEKSALPLQSRPLLVPISASVNDLEVETLEALQPQLGNLGIQLDFIGASRVLIRSVPVEMPYLDVQALIPLLLAKSPKNVEQLRSCLLAAQSFSAKTLGEDEQAQLFQYLLTLDNPGKISVCLDMNTCLELSNG